MSKKQFLDSLLGKLVSRKLLVFIIATIGMLCSSIESADWVTISIVYIGGQAIVDAVKALRG